MSFDKNNLKLARKWAEICGNSTGERISFESVEAATQIIRGLPDEIVDAAKLREVIDKLRSEGDYVSENLADELDKLLPTPAPAVEVRMGAWVHHPEHGKVMIVSAKPDEVGDLAVAKESDDSGTGSVLAWVKNNDLSPLEEKPLFITHHHWSAGNKYATGGILAPEDQPGDMYRDKDGDIWVMHPENKQWSMLSHEYGDYKLPEEYAPYTKIEKP